MTTPPPKKKMMVVKENRVNSVLFFFFGQISRNYIIVSFDNSSKPAVLPYFRSANVDRDMENNMNRHEPQS